MAPTSQDDPGPNLMSTYLERFGGYGSQKLLGLLQYQLAQASDLLASGSDQGAADIIAQAMIMVDQVCVDSGRTDLGFLFSLQPDPPTAVFVNHGSMPTAGLRCQRNSNVQRPGLRSEAGTPRDAADCLCFGARVGASSSCLHWEFSCCMWCPGVLSELASWPCFGFGLGWLSWPPGACQCFLQLAPLFWQS